MDIRQGEGGRVALMFSYIFLVIGALMIVKPVAGAMFLSTFGATRLPLAFIMVAVLAVSLSSLYARWLRRLDFFRLVIRTLQTCILCLAIFWLALSTREVRGPTVFVLYIWVALAGLILVSQFWLLANTIFNPREAKRLFGVVGAGAIAGGIAGGYATNLLAGWLGSANLILLAGLCLSICIVLAKRLYRDTKEDEHLLRLRQKELAAAESIPPMVAVTRSRHLRLLAGIIGLGVVAAKLVEYQFSAVATAEIPDPDRLAAFFGFWLSNLNVVSLLIQLFVTRRVVGLIGVGISLFFLPLTIMLGSVLLMAHPGLWAAIFLKTGDGSLKNSINKAALELIILPVPVEVKNQAKSFIDVIVDSAATGLGGLLLLGITAVYGASVQPVAVATILTVVLWGGLIRRVRRSYVDAFRLTLARDDEPTPTPAPAGTTIVGSLIDALADDRPDAIRQALVMARTVHQRRLVPSFLHLLDHPSADIRLEAMRCLYPYRDTDALIAVEKIIRDGPAAEGRLGILTEAMHYLFRHGEGDRVARLAELMARADPVIGGAALICAARESRRNPRLRETLNVNAAIAGLLTRIPRQQDAGQARLLKQVCATAIGAANIHTHFPYLNLFLNDGDEAVRIAAVAAAGRTRDEGFLPSILNGLREGGLQQACGEALQQFGPDVEPFLADCLANPLVDHTVRYRIPAVLATLASQRAVNILLASLREKDTSVRSVCIDALNRLRQAKIDLHFDDQAVVRCVLRETRRHRNMLAALYYQIRKTSPTPSDKAVRAFRRRLAGRIEKRLDVNLSHIFSLLGLKYPAGDIQRAYRGLISDQPDLRANAIEFLDNVLETDLKRTIIPIVETALVDRMIAQTIEQLGADVPKEIDAFALMLPEADAELQLAALELIARLEDPAYAGLAAELMGSANPGVREAAGALFRKWGY